MLEQLHAKPKTNTSAAQPSLPACIYAAWRSVKCWVGTAAFGEGMSGHVMQISFNLSLHSITEGHAGRLINERLACHLCAKGLAASSPRLLATCISLHCGGALQEQQLQTLLLHLPKLALIRAGRSAGHSSTLYHPICGHCPFISCSLEAAQWLSPQ